MIILGSLFSLLIISSPLWGQEIKRDLQPVKLGVTVEDYKEIVENNKDNFFMFTFLDKEGKVYVRFVLDRELRAIDRKIRIVKNSNKSLEGTDYLINAKVIKRNDLQSPNIYFRFDLPTWGADKSDRSVGKESGILSLIELVHVKTKKPITKWSSYCKISYKEGVLMLDEPFIEEKLRTKMTKIFSEGINIEHD
ncbi:MAG: hypothetical protein J4F35_20650 [Candidatus Latescibacteria bacterium]|nr:hypothetical protein [Candidatus Latescibacterota bacterium]